MEKYQNKIWFMWIMLVTITPIGIMLMWKNSIFTTEKRVRATLIFSLLFIAAILQMINEYKNSIIIT